LAKNGHGVRTEVLAEALRMRKVGEHLLIGDLVEAIQQEQDGRGEQAELPFDPYNNR